jgi:electron transport complex protein RnfE
MSKALGPYVPLIIVNCIIIGRAEACASKNSLIVSITDALGMSVGFTFALCVLASIRELLGAGTIFDYPVLSSGWFTPWTALVMPGGAFLTLGLLLGLINVITKRNKQER